MGEGTGGAVLYVDDPERATAVAERIEARADLAVETEPSPDDAVERLDGASFDCLLCACDPASSETVDPADTVDVGAVDLVRRVRALHPDLPIVALAGDRSAAREAVSAGGTDYVLVDGCPAASDLLATRVETVVEKGRAERALREERRRSDEFVQLVAHDIRNLLTVARGWVDELHDGGGEAEYRKAIDALDRMTEIVANVEELACSDAAEADDERVELSAVATAAWEVVDTGDAELHVEFGPELRADPSMLQQALENLFRNAIEHGSTSPRQAEDVTVEVRTIEGAPGRNADRPLRVDDGAEDSRTGFYVADDGTGFSETDCERVFESGYTGGDGSGLGLAIVRRIADAHGWEVTARESADGGARFEFTGVTIERSERVRG